MFTMSSPKSQNLSVKIVTADYYLHKPISDFGDQCYSAFRSLPVYRVPVIRIFGPTSEGIKTCLHVHGVFPYMFVPNWNNQIEEKELYHFAVNLDKAINTSFAHCNSKSSHVHKITSVSGMPFYGYHESERNFLKIEFYNPAMVKRASDLLLNGAVLNTIFQPHEAHIPFILQFFIDNNLYGMNNITFSAYKVRKNNIQDDRRIGESFTGPNNLVYQQSYSKLEIDVAASNLCNVANKEESIPNNPGLAFIWEDEKKRRRFDKKLSSQITPNESQQRPEKPITRTESYFREKLIQKLQAIKNNATCMEIDIDETTSLNSTYEELNTQSKCLLEILQSFTAQQKKSKETVDSGSSSPSLVYSDDENKVADVSLISSRPLLKFNAEDDSILGNNFSDDENDIDDQDHRALSQTINYSRHQNMSSSEDSDVEVRLIPQLDGAYDTISTKKSTTKKVKPLQSHEKVIKLSYDVQNQDNSIKKKFYNLRSSSKPTEEIDKKINFQPKAFKILLEKLELPETSPKKTYPRLKIDTQRSPRSNNLRLFNNYVNVSSEIPKLVLQSLTNETTEETLPLTSRTVNKSHVPLMLQSSSTISSERKNARSLLKSEEPVLLIPRLTNEFLNKSSLSEPRSRTEFTSSFTKISPKKTHKSVDNSVLPKCDKKAYPQLDINRRKSPMLSQKFTLDEAIPFARVSSSHGVKKRKIIFGDGESLPSKSEGPIKDANLLSPKWRKSLKKRRKDDTSFKIGNSFSLLGFRNSKKDQNADQGCEDATSFNSLINTGETNSPSYSLHTTGTDCLNISGRVLEKSNQKNESTEMAKLQISGDEDINGEIKSNCKVVALASQRSDSLMMESDDDSLLAVPLEADQDAEIVLQVNSSPKMSNSSIDRFTDLSLSRSDPDMINDFVSVSFCESSSIKLNISESSENSARSQLKSIEISKLTALNFEEKNEFDLKTEVVNVAASQCLNNGNVDPSFSKFIGKIVLDTKDELIDGIKLYHKSEKNSNARSQSTKSSQSEPQHVNISKKPAANKKRLGMRIQKNMIQSTCCSGSKQSTSRALPKIEVDGKSVKKLPTILVDKKDGQNEKFDKNLATSSDPYPNSNIKLHFSCTSDSLSKIEVEASKDDSNVLNSTNSNDATCDKYVLLDVIKPISLPFSKDNMIELDILKFYSESSEDSTKETHNIPEPVQNESFPTFPIYKYKNDANNYDRIDEALLPSSTLKDSNAVGNQVALSDPKLLEEENLNSSQFICNDEILSRTNDFSSDSAINNSDLVLSQEIMFEENLMMNKNLVASQSIFNDEETSFSNSNLLFSRGISSVQKLNAGLPKQMIDNSDTYLNQADSTESSHKLNKNLVASASFFDDEFLYGSALSVKPTSSKTSLQHDNESKSTENSKKPILVVDEGDLNASCGNNSLLNVIDSLTPRTKKILNRKLNSSGGDNILTSFSQQTDSLPTLAALIRNPSDGISKDSFAVKNLAMMPKPTDAEQNSEQSKSLEESSFLDILNKSSCALNLDSSTSNYTRGSVHEAVSFEEDLFDLEFSSFSAQRENKLSKKTPSLDEVLLNNSIWDSMDSDLCTQEDNEIRSFYHDHIATPAHISIIRDIAEDLEDSSPIAKSLTPESQMSNEILSFYGSQSPKSMICSISQDLPVTFEATTTRRAIGPSSSAILHSTSASSPLYTPILKKLMVKKFNKKDTCRISSQRFLAEPFLPEIREEDEAKRKESDKNTTLSLPFELEFEVSKIDNKSILNTSKTSTFSGASYQIDGASLENTCGFKMNLENLQDVKTDKQFQFITLISLEIFAQSRGDLKPDPEYDSITCLFYCIHHDAPEVPHLISGLIVVSEEALSLDLNRFKCEKLVVLREAELLDAFLALIRKWDPDIFIGYEVEMLSWGFLIQRGYFLGRNLSQELSRVRETKQNELFEGAPYENDDYSNEIKLIGRIVLNVWRLMRHELNLQSYTFESILFHVLHQRVPFYDFKFLTGYWKDTFKKWIVVDYFLFRAESNIILLEQLDFICKTSELARLFGIQFYEVLSRGSQFRVESMMLRLAKTQNYVTVSPSVKQRAHMRAPESLPLIMEPQSKFYTDPIIVLDFQSLYPSIIIAYNYCFSTCLGRIANLGQNEPFHFGCIEHTVSGDLLVKLENSLNLSPAGIAFVDKTIRKGILSSMLEEILETRLMVKKSMKENKNNSTLKRVLHARQLGLKLIANVTYGYTSANFSGRMPCMEIADSVVSKGRETLERAIELVNETKKWDAKVVYGDTDSLFVLVPNRSRKEAFRIGSEIADAVTNQNPKPVKLKLEKVYTASILQTKKRYVGYMYESPDQEKPTYDAKGIETVRRDGCPAVSKILEKSLQLLFETKNVNTVKQYVQRQFAKLIAGRINIQELTFAREYRGLNNYKPAACVPALQLAKQALLKDRRAEPRIKERVRYVIVTGAPGVPLIRLVRTPLEFLNTPGSMVNVEYYITRAIIPALERCFTLMNVSVQAWYKEMPKKQKLNLPIDYEVRNKAFKKTTISHYFNSSKCISCSKVAGRSICRECEHKPQRLALILGNMINQFQRKYNNVAKICRSCCGRNEPIGCSSLDCPVYYLFRLTDHEAEQVRYAENLKREYLHF